MLIIVIVSAILSSEHVQVAVQLSNWFGQHIILTILLCLFLA